MHATKRWPGVVTIHLWTYAIRMENQAYNATPLNSHMNKQSPNKSLIIQRLTSIRNTGSPLDVKLTYSDQSSKGLQAYTQNGIVELEQESPWSNHRSTIEMWHWF